MNQRGITALILLVLISVISLALVFIFTRFLPQFQKNQLNNNQTGKKEAVVELKKEYQNPFDKNTQYVNPFSEYKNPFDSLK